MTSLSLAYQRTNPVNLLTNEFLNIATSGSLSVTGIAVTSAGEQIIMANAGMIFGSNQAVAASGPLGRLSNSGVMLAASSAAAVSLGGGGAIGARWTVSNSGTIEAMARDGSALTFQGGGNLVYNSGQILSFSGTALSFAAAASTQDNVVSNLGTLHAFDVALQGGSDALNLTNLGTIVGRIVLGGRADQVTNTGQITGAVDLGGGDDLFNGRSGVVNGTVAGGSGNDRYILDSEIALTELAGGGTDTVESHAAYTLADNIEVLLLRGSLSLRGVGNALDNTLHGSAGHDTLSGREGADTILGGGGDDFVWAGTGADSVFGGDGDDDLRLGAGNDTGLGEDGNDLIHGRLGNDSLLGGAGEDTLTGGAGRDTLDGGDDADLLRGGADGDTLTGGAGADVFDWNAVTDAHWTDHDVVTDFTPGTDKLDFSTLISGVFALNINGGYSGNGQPSIRTWEVNGSTRLLVDVNGDSTREMRIDLLNVYGVTQEDFYL